MRVPKTGNIADIASQRVWHTHSVLFFCVSYTTKIKLRTWIIQRISRAVESIKNIARRYREIIFSISLYRLTVRASYAILKLESYLCIFILFTFDTDVPIINFCNFFDNWESNSTSTLGISFTEISIKDFINIFLRNSNPIILDHKFIFKNKYFNLSSSVWVFNSIF